MTDDIDEVDPVNGIEGCMNGQATLDVADVGPICCGSISITRDGAGMLIKHVTDLACTHRCCHPLARLTA